MIDDSFLSGLNERVFPVRKTTDNNEYGMTEKFSLTVHLGLIVVEEQMDVVSVLASIKNIIHRIEKILLDTPHIYSFILPYKPGPEHLIIESLLSDRMWGGSLHAVLKLLRMSNETSDPVPDFECGIKYDISTVSWEDAIPGADPVYDAVIEWSDLVILVGQWEPGSTEYQPGSVFDLARLRGRTIVAINPVVEDIYEIPHDDMIFESFEHLNEYNREKVTDHAFRETISRYKGILRDECRDSGLSEDVITPAYETLLPHFTRAKLLSKKYRRRFAWAGILISSLAALAIFTITVQTLFFPHWPFLVWIEVLEILIIILLMFASRAGNFHRKWIDYNFLAERIRAAFFFCLVSNIYEKPDAPPNMTYAIRPNDWIVMAFGSIMENMPLSYCRLEIQFNPLKSFFRSAWIKERLQHFKDSAKNSRREYVLLLYMGETLFLLTLILAVMHALGIGHWEIFFNVTVSMVMVCLTITLPAFGAAVGAIMIQREYLRNFERNSHLVRHLTSLNNTLWHARNISELRELMEDMNEIMLREQHDWRIIFRFRRIEVM